MPVVDCRLKLSPVMGAQVPARHSSVYYPKVSCLADCRCKRKKGYASAGGASMKGRALSRAKSSTASHWHSAADMHRDLMSKGQAPGLVLISASESALLMNVAKPSSPTPSICFGAIDFTKPAISFTHACAPEESTHQAEVGGWRLDKGE